MKIFVLSILILLAIPSAQSAEWSGGVAFGSPASHENFKGMLDFLGVSYKTENYLNREVIYWDSDQNDKVQRVKNLVYDGTVNSKISVLQALGEDKPEYMNFLVHSAEDDDPVAQYFLGREYFFGSIVSTDYAKAKSLFEMSFKQNNLDSAGMLSVMYEGGFGVPASEDKAKEYLEVSASSGDPFASCKLANYIRDGLLGYQVDESLIQYWEDRAFQNKEVENFSCDTYFK